MNLLVTVLKAVGLAVVEMIRAWVIEARRVRAETEAAARAEAMRSVGEGKRVEDASRVEAGKTPAPGEAAGDVDDVFGDRQG